MKRLGKMSVAGWVALAVAIVAGSMSASDAQTLQVERSGQTGGAAVVFIPGLATAGAVWNDTVDALGGAGIEAHVVTLAGFGGLAPADRGEAGVIEAAVADIRGYINSVGLSDVTLVGHSMGAQIALQIADDPAVRHVVVVDSAPFFARLFNPAITADQARAYGTMMAAQMGSAPREQFLAVSRQGLAVQSITPDGQAQVMAWMEASDQATVATALGEVMSADFSPVLDDVDVPVSVLFAWSEGMPMSAEALESVYQGQYAPLDRVAFHRIDGSRHFIMLDQAEAFRAVLSGVIAGEEDR